MTSNKTPLNLKFILYFVYKHERYVRDCKRYEPNVVFIGDGLVERMQHTPVSTAI